MSICFNIATKYALFMKKIWANICKELYLMKKYEKVKEWLELLNSIEIGHNFKEIIKRQNTYLEPIFSSPEEKSTLISLAV